MLCMCVYVTPVPIDQNLRAASSVTRGPFRKWRQFQLAVVVKVLLLSFNFFALPAKRKKYQHDRQPYSRTVFNDIFQLAILMIITLAKHKRHAP